MSIINLTVTPPPVINIAVTESAPIALTVSQPDPINLTVYPTLVGDIVGGASDRYWDEYVLVKSLETGGTDAGDWSETVALGGTITYSGGAAILSTTTTSNSRADLRDSDPGVTGVPASWSCLGWRLNGMEVEGRVKINSINSSGVAVFGLYRTHTTNNQLIYGFVPDTTTGNWKIQITTEYVDFYSYATGVSYSDYHDLKVVVGNQLNSLSFYIDGTLVLSIANGQIIGATTIVLASEYPANTGFWYGGHVRNRSSGTPAIVMSIDSMTAKQSDIPLHKHNIADIRDIITSGVTDGQVLTYDSTNAVWQGETITIPPSTKIAPFFKNYSGQRLTGLLTAATLISVSWNTNDSMRLYPVRFPYNLVISGFEMYVLTGGSSTAIKMCLYDSDADGRPIGSPLQESGSIATTASGTLLAYAFPTNRTLYADKTYWVGFRFQSISAFAVSFRASNATPMAILHQTPTSTAPNNVISLASTYTGAAPNFTTTPWNPATQSTNNNVPVVYFVVA